MIKIIYYPPHSPFGDSGDQHNNKVGDLKKKAFVAKIKKSQATPQRDFVNSREAAIYSQHVVPATSMRFAHTTSPSEGGWGTNCKFSGVAPENLQCARPLHNKAWPKKSNHKINNQLTNFLKHYKFLKKTTDFLGSCMSPSPQSGESKTLFLKEGTHTWQKPKIKDFEKNVLIGQRGDTENKASLYLCGLKNKTAQIKGNSILALINKHKQPTTNKIKNRNYLFLQTILSKYMDTLSFARPMVKSAPPFGGQYVPLSTLKYFTKKPTRTKINQKLSLCHKKSAAMLSINYLPSLYFSITGNKSSDVKNNATFFTNYFLLTKITNKSFLGYWLLPIIGLAMLVRVPEGHTHITKGQISPVSYLSTKEGTNNTHNDTNQSSPLYIRANKTTFLNSLYLCGLKYKTTQIKRSLYSSKTANGIVLRGAGTQQKIATQPPKFFVHNSSKNKRPLFIDALKNNGSIIKAKALNLFHAHFSNIRPIDSRIILTKNLDFVVALQDNCPPSSPLRGGKGGGYLATDHLKGTMLNEAFVDASVLHNWRLVSIAGTTCQDPLATTVSQKNVAQKPFIIEPQKNNVYFNIVPHETRPLSNYVGHEQQALNLMTSSIKNSLLKANALFVEKIEQINNKKSTNVTYVPINSPEGWHPAPFDKGAGYSMFSKFSNSIKLFFSSGTSFNFGPLALSASLNRPLILTSNGTKQQKTQQLKYQNFLLDFLSPKKSARGSKKQHYILIVAPHILEQKNKSVNIKPHQRGAFVRVPYKYEGFANIKGEGSKIISRTDTHKPTIIPNQRFVTFSLGAYLQEGIAAPPFAPPYRGGEEAGQKALRSLLWTFSKLNACQKKPLIKTAAQNKSRSYNFINKNFLSIDAPFLRQNLYKTNTNGSWLSEPFVAKISPPGGQGLATPQNHEHNMQESEKYVQKPFNSCEYLLGSNINTTQIKLRDLHVGVRASQFVPPPIITSAQKSAHKAYSLEQPVIAKRYYDYFNYIHKKLKKFVAKKRSRCGVAVDLHSNATKASLNGQIIKAGPVSSIYPARRGPQAITIVFKHKKMLKKLNTYKKTDSNKFLIIDSRQYLQKKRKAKKQRLETRRQKKRTRLYPRPTWIRFRMFANFLRTRSINGSFISDSRSIFDMQHDPIKIGPLKSVKFVARVPFFNLAHKNRSRFMFLDKCVFFKKTRTEHQQNKRSSATSVQNQDTILQPNNKDLKNIQEILPRLKKGKGLWPIKNSTNYVNFKSQKQNNQPNQPSSNNFFWYRDFWIWVYNMTANNKYNQVIFTKNQIIKWAINKTTNKYTFTQYNKRYNLWGTQKIRNQSKNNKTILLLKQFGLFKTNFFLNKNLILFNKKIYAKMRHSLHKFNYLNSTSVLLGKKYFIKTQTRFSEKYSHKDAYAQLLKDSNFYKSNLLVKFPWWYVDSWQLKTTGLEPQAIQQRLETPPKIQSGDKVQNLDPLVVCNSVLFHFCALISLISISQLRCFIKFHIILIYKISNIYSLSITRISHYIASFLLIKKDKHLKINYGKKLAQGFSKNIPNRDLPPPERGLYNTPLMGGTTRQVYTPEGGTYSLGSPINDTKKSNATKQKNKFILSNVNDFLNIYSEPTPQKLQLALSLNLFKKQFVKVSQPKGLYAPGAYKTLYFSHTPKNKDGGMAENKSGVLNNKGFVQQKSKNLAYNILACGPLYLRSGENNKSKLSLNLFKNYTSKNYLNYKIFATQNLFFKKSIYRTQKSIINICLKTIFYLIDMFQSTLRSISAFFEKPAEFTTSWIAYGFLVEWSSDLLAIIPENVDIYLWTTFSKFSRSLVSPFGGHLPIANLSLFAFSLGGPLYFKAHFFRQLTSTQATLGSFFVISNLLQRRVAYLFDSLIKTVSQPDADLIRRQQKGTLFWDIWADFLVTAADQYNINIAALSTIKAEQNNLIENITNAGTQQARYFSGNRTASPFLRQQVASVAKIKNFLGHKHLFGNVNYVVLNKKNQKEFTLLLQDPINRSIIPGGDNTTPGGRWTVNQFITYQSWNNNSDLFIDYHPPKSFNHLPMWFKYNGDTHMHPSSPICTSIKYNKALGPIQQPIGTLVCQIYAGIFNKQISKNILLVNNQKTISNGFALNIKRTSNFKGVEPLLFRTNNVNYNALLIQALAGETELKIITDNAKRYALVNRGFAIGIKLLRDVFDKIKLTTPCIFLLEDIHAIGERRPMLISDYGGDDSKITNESFFGGSQLDEVHEKNQVIYQNFFHAITHYKKPFKGDYSNAIPTNKYLTDLYSFLRSQTTNNLSLTVNNNTTLKPKIETATANKDSNNIKGGGAATYKKTSNLSTHLQLPAESSQLTPPSTSPFNVLLPKESQNIIEDLQNKVVQELNFLGLQYQQREQLSTKPRISYSVRAKVSMLAELSLSNLSAKLDMITDLLVIIDSVRGNKGFVVFATTDVPHILDPALRRPGRLDETICMPNITTTSAFSFVMLATQNSRYAAPPTLTINLNNACGNNNRSQNLNNALLSKSKYLLTTTQLTSINKATHLNKKATMNKGFANIIGEGSKMISRTSLNKNKSGPLLFLPQQALAYYEISKAILNFKIQMGSFILGQGRNFNNKNSLSFGANIKAKKNLNCGLKNKTTQIKGTSFKGAQQEYLVNYLANNINKNFLSQQIMLLFAGKIGQNLARKKVSPLYKRTRLVGGEENPSYLKVGIENKDIQLATTLMLAFIQKRYLYHQNLIVPKLLNFLDGQILDEPPSPPFSNLLIPAKRFENYKRVFHDSIFADHLGTYTNRKPINYYEKIQEQFQLSSIKKLAPFNVLVPDKSFTDNKGEGDSRTSNLKGRLIETNFLKKLYQLKSLQTSTNTNWYYQNRILKRHSQYLINQWWNGQLSEHNAETVFLSDIDWRSSFIKPSKLARDSKTKVSVSDAQDVLLDFPDADQIYNTRRRRWLLNKGYWSFWFNIDKIYEEQLIRHLVLESITKTYTYLYNNGELLDYLTAKFITSGFVAHTEALIPPKKNFQDFFLGDSIKEIHLTQSFSRFEF